MIFLKDQWKTTPITISTSDSASLNLFALNDTTLLITGVSASTKDFALYKLTLSALL